MGYCNIQPLQLDPHPSLCLHIAEKVHTNVIKRRRRDLVLYNVPAQLLLPPHAKWSPCVEPTIDAGWEETGRAKSELWRGGGDVLGNKVEIGR